jgi:hypothetical protein
MLFLKNVGLLLKEGNNSSRPTSVKNPVDFKDSDNVYRRSGKDDYRGGNEPGLVIHQLVLK